MKIEQKIKLINDCVNEFISKYSKDALSDFETLTMLSESDLKNTSDLISKTNATVRVNYKKNKSGKITYTPFKTTKSKSYHTMINKNLVDFILIKVGVDLVPKFESVYKSLYKKAERHSYVDLDSADFIKSKSLNISKDELFHKMFTEKFKSRKSYIDLLIKIEDENIKKMDYYKKIYNTYWNRTLNKKGV